MAEGLPEGLIRSNTEVVSEGIERHDRVSEDDLARLWKAYATNRRLLVNDIGRRLENFFWRLWSSRRCQEKLQGSQVAFLFALISEGEIIRTTPIPSPRTSRIVTRTIDQELPSTPISPSPSSPIELDRRGSSTPKPSKLQSLPPSIEEEKGRRRSSSRPAPILKRPGVESSLRKSATIVTPTWKSSASDPEHDEATAPLTRQRSSLSSVESADDLEPPYSPKTEDENGISQPDSKGITSGSKGKKKAMFFVGTSKRRPAINRRKSSQSSSGTSKTNSPKPMSASPLNSLGVKRTSVTSYTSEIAESPVPNASRSMVVAGQSQARSKSHSVNPVASTFSKQSTLNSVATSNLSSLAPMTNVCSREPLVERSLRTKSDQQRRSQGAHGPMGLAFGGLAKSSAATSLSTSFHANGSSFTSLNKLDLHKAGGESKGKERTSSSDTESSHQDEETMENLTLERLPSQVVEEDEEDEDEEEEEEDSESSGLEMRRSQRAKTETQAKAQQEAELAGIPRVKSQLAHLLGKNSKSTKEGRMVTGKQKVQSSAAPSESVAEQSLLSAAKSKNKGKGYIKGPGPRVSRRGN